jgi:hypothetical protein
VTAARVRAWLVRRWWALGIVLVFGYAFPHYPSIRSANELPRVYLVMAMADGGVAIDKGVARWGTTVDVSPSRGHQYSNKAPGSSILAVPAYVALRGATHLLAGREPTLGEMVWTFRLWTGAIPTLLFLWLLWGFLARFAPDPAARRATIAIYGLGSMALTYSVLFISHQLAAVCVGTAWILAVRVAEDPSTSLRAPGLRSRGMLAAGFFAGAAPLCDYQALFAAVPVAIWVTVELIRTGRGWRPFALAALGAAVPIAALLLYHDAAFGSPWRTGYDASTTFAHFHQRGFLGLDQFRPEALYGSMLAPDNGLLLLCPALLLVVPGWILMIRHGRLGHALVSVAVALIYVAFISSIAMWRGGWQMGPRYITAMLPFVLPAIAATLQAVAARPVLRGLALGLGGVGVAIYAGSIVEFPHFPEKFKNPVHEVTVRLIGDGLAAPNLGMALGLPGAWSLVPYAALVLALWGAVVWVGPDRRARLTTTAIAVAVTAIVLVAYRGFPGGGRVADEAYARTVRPAVHGQMR